MNEAALTRRNLILATGAGLALAACDGGTTGQRAKDGKLCHEGIDPSWGDDPNIDFPNVSFEPQYITLVKIESNGPWDISSNHASFDVKGMDETKRKDLAGEIFKRFKSTKPIHKFGELQHGHTKEYGIKERKGGGYDRDDFREFQFGHQHEIYIWFDSDKVSLVRPKTGPARLIAMSAARADGTPTAKNKSFYAGEYGANPTDLKGPIIVVRNYFRDENEAPITDTKDLLYSMNIFFKAQNKQKAEMTIILDPDTGNGVGFDPLTVA